MKEDGQTEWGGRRTMGQAGSGREEKKVVACGSRTAKQNWLDPLLGLAVRRYLSGMTPGSGFVGAVLTTVTA